MGKVRNATARALLPNLFDSPVTMPPPEVAAELIPLLERLLLAGGIETTVEPSKAGRDARER